MTRMSATRASRRVGFSPEASDHGPTVLLKDELRRRSHSPPLNRKKRVVGILCFRVPRGSTNLQPSALRLLRRFGTKVARALKLVFTKRRSSRKVSSLSSSLTRSRSLPDSVDSHRAEAIEDCIKFLNLHRSNSVSASS